MHQQATDALREITPSPGVTGETITAALKCVGLQTYGKNDISPAWIHGVMCANENPLNCWASAAYWAFQGGALKKSWLDGYVAQVGQGTAVNGNAGANLARACLFGYHTMGTSDGTAPPGAMVFFSTFIGPLSHVALAIGGGLIVSNWLNADKGTSNPLLREGKAHVETIETMKGVAGGDHCTVTWTRRPFWGS